MVPVIALVGRPNVGKSTLFNKLTKSKDALVADFSGLTRDRQYGDALFENKPFIVIDTGGIGVDDLSVDALMSRQSKVAIEEADIVFFLVEARSGLTPVDEDIASKLRKEGKKVVVVINKIDGLDESQACAEFQSLGFDKVFAISATHNRGLSNLLEKITEEFPERVEIDTDLLDGNINLAFIGRPNVGKSTLINRMLGQERVVVYDMPGTTRDSIAIPFTRDDQNYTLIDTAGIRRRGKVNLAIEKFSIVKTLQSIKDTNVCLLLIDAQEGLTEQDMHLLGYIIEAGKGVVIVVNKWDGLDEEHKEAVKSTLGRRLKFINYAKVRYISALHGTGVGNLFADVLNAYKSANKKLSTPKLTKLLMQFVEDHQPPLVKGRRVKLRYAHTGGHNPPIIVIHGNQVQSLPDSYKKYLANSFSDKLEMVGTPLKIEFKSGDNPYKDKKNKLTPRQIHKKRRLFKRKAKMKK